MDRTKEYSFVLESRHCGQDKRILFCPVHNALTPCSLQAFGIRCIKFGEKGLFRTENNCFGHKRQFGEKGLELRRTPIITLRNFARLV